MKSPDTKKPALGGLWDYFVYIFKHDQNKIQAVSTPEKTMDDITRVKCLTIAMIVTGLFFIFAVLPLMEWIWPEGWGWIPQQYEYEHHIAGIFATLGIFLIFASKNPIANIILIWFTIWLNLIYATISLLLVINDRFEEQNLIGDIPIQYLIAGVLWYLIPRNLKRLHEQLKSDSK